VKDATAGKSTYGGGRYLPDTGKSADLGGDNGRLILDFHLPHKPPRAHHPAPARPLSPPRHTPPPPPPPREPPPPPNAPPPPFPRAGAAPYGCAAPEPAPAAGSRGGRVTGPRSSARAQVPRRPPTRPRGPLYHSTPTLWEQQYVHRY